MVEATLLDGCLAAYGRLDPDRCRAPAGDEGALDVLVGALVQALGAAVEALQAIALESDLDRLYISILRGWTA